MKRLEEEWRDILGYEGLYQVSNLGNVRSLDRIITQNNTQWGKSMERRIKGQLLTPTDNGNGYKIVGLRREYNGLYVKKNHYVHRLVAEAFLGCVGQDKVINHIDYDTSNNKASNLEITTQAKNIKYSAKHMRKPKTKCKKTNTGEKYIHRQKNGMYRVCIKSLEICKTFESLNCAITYRNEVLGDGKEYYAV